MERIALFLLLLNLAGPALAQEVRLDPREEVREWAQAEEPMELKAMIQAALLFSGAGESDLPASGAAFDRLITAIRAELDTKNTTKPDPRLTAEEALAYLHRTVLKRYDERQTGVDVLLAHGIYNCVSSGVVYAIVLKALGFRVWGVRTADHAFCRVQAGEQAFDVETTSPFGFDPGTRKDFTDSFGRITGYTYVPPSNYRDRRDIGEKELLALILFNRSAFATGRRDYPGAVPPAVDAYALLGDEESHQRLITSLLNFASWQGMGGRFGPALEFLDRAVESYADPRLESLRGDLVHNWAVTMIQSRNFAEAQSLLDSQRGSITDREWRELTVFLYQARAQQAAPDYAEAIRLIQEGLEKVGSDQGLIKSFEVYVHNTVVTLARAGRYQEAYTLLEEALSRLPGSSVLLKDKSMVLEAAGRQ